MLLHISTQLVLMKVGILVKIQMESQIIFLPYVTQVAVGKLEYVNVFGNDYPTPDGTGVPIISMWLI